MTDTIGHIGVLPAIFASLLLPGSKKQKVPALPFVIGSFAGGYFLIGPYLGLRELSTSGSSDDVGRGNFLFESKLVPVVLLGFSSYLLHYAVTGDYSSDKISDFIRLFTSQKLVTNSTIDFTVLSLVVWDAINEDMQRRRFQGPSATTFALLPVFGPLVYLLLRPSLPNNDELS